MKRVIMALGLFIFLSGSGSVWAVPIEGEIYFVGNATVTGPATTDDYDLANATGISFGSVFVSEALGDFAANGVGFPDFVAFNDFSWEPSLEMSDPTAPLWSVGGYTFDLNSVIVTEQSSSQLALAGTGVLRYNGGDETLASWSFSGDTAGSKFWFTSASAASVPEPASIGLLGMGLLGLGFAKRRNKA